MNYYNNLEVFSSFISTKFPEGYIAELQQKRGYGVGEQRAVHVLHIQANLKFKILKI